MFKLEVVCIPTPKVKPFSRVVDRFKKRVAVAAPDYEFGVTNPRYDWLEHFKDMIEAMVSAIMAAKDAGVIHGGAERKGTAFWKERAKRKGKPRWEDETPKSGDYYGSQVKDFLSQIETTAIEPRKKRGDPANVSGRVAPIVKALFELSQSKRGYKK